MPPNEGLTSDQLLTLVVAILGFFATVGVAIWTQWQANKQRRADRAADAEQRDADRKAEVELRETDREHAMKMEAVAARRAVADHYRDQRQEAYRALLDLLDEADRLMLAVMMRERPDIQDLLERAKKPLATVRLLSSDDVAQAAEKISRLLHAVDFGFRVDELAPDTGSDARQKKIIRNASECRAAIKELPPVIRIELGSSSA